MLILHKFNMILVTRRLSDQSVVCSVLMVPGTIHNFCQWKTGKERSQQVKSSQAKSSQVEPSRAEPSRTLQLKWGIRLRYGNEGIVP